MIKSKKNYWMIDISKQNATCALNAYLKHKTNNRILKHNKRGYTSRRFCSTELLHSINCSLFFLFIYLYCFAKRFLFHSLYFSKYLFQPPLGYGRCMFNYFVHRFVEQRCPKIKVPVFWDFYTQNSYFVWIALNI